MTQLRWKGELADGHVHMTAQEYYEHHVAEEHEQIKQILRKAGNNPILSEEVKTAIRFAVYRLDDITWYRKRISDLQEEIENMKKARIYVK